VDADDKRSCMNIETSKGISLVTLGLLLFLNWGALFAWQFVPLLPIFVESQ